MKLYLACIGQLADNLPGLAARVRHRVYELRSYAEWIGYDPLRLPVYGKDFFLDSGAFSAKSQGLEIDVSTYGGFVKRHLDQIQYFANLDDIPRDASDQAELRRSAQQTYENQRRLEDIVGKAPLPVFHKGEDWEFLERYLPAYNYILIGGLVATGGGNNDFFNKLFSEYCTNKDGTPTHKLHAFGLAGSIPVLRDYPWYSTDSSSWLITGKVGQILVPLKTNGKWDFTQRGEAVNVSNKSSSRQEFGAHWDTLPEQLKEYTLEWLSELGIEFKDVEEWAYSRFMVNAEFWMRFGEQGNFATKYQPKQVTLL